MRVQQVLRTLILRLPSQLLRTTVNRRNEAPILQRYLALILPCTIWFCLFLFFQMIDPYWTISKCRFPEPTHLNLEQNQHNILLIADPQLIDNHTYPGRNDYLLQLSKFTVDNHIYKNYKALLNQLNPDSIIYLGDLLDNSRSSTDEYYSHELSRFNSIFKKPLDHYSHRRKPEVHYNIPGNHDIGWANGVHKHALQRFDHDFGDPINKMITINNHDLIFLDTISLSNTEDPEIYEPPRKFLDQLSKEPKVNPRIMFSHVTLYRDPKKSVCGPLRESKNLFPLTMGYQYQTVIDEELTKEILEKIEPDIVYAGDDHDYCETVIPYPESSFSTTTQDEDSSKIDDLNIGLPPDIGPQTIPDSVAEELTVDSRFYKKRSDTHVSTNNLLAINVKSISMAMGIYKPAVQLLTLYSSPISNEPLIASSQQITPQTTLLTTMCYLSTPYEDVIFYSIFAFLNFVYFVYVAYKEGLNSDRSGRNARYVSLINDELYNEPDIKGWVDRLKVISYSKLIEFCLVELALVLVVYNLFFTVHFS